MQQIHLNYPRMIESMEYACTGKRYLGACPGVSHLNRILTQDSTAKVLQDLNYAYDSVGNIVAITDRINTGTQTFKYDALNRLTYAKGGLIFPRKSGHNGELVSV
jgi:YD repeat-containing protein